MFPSPTSSNLQTPTYILRVFILLEKICLWTADSFDISMYSNVASESITKMIKSVSIQILDSFLRAQFRL